MALTLFVSEAYIKSFTPIGQLVDWSEVSPTAELCQDSFIQDILGTNFYVYLQGKYIAQTLTADETTLVSKIKPALGHRAAEMCVPFINYQLKNKGLMTQTGDYAAGSDLDTVRYIRGEVMDRAEFYEQRLIKYLCENGSLFPEYQNDNDDDMPPNSDSPYNSPIIFI